MMSKKKISKIIQESGTFLLSTHVNPDPDALCSELALAEYLRSLGKKVRIINETELLDRFRFFPGAGRIQHAAELKSVKYDAAIILDCGDLGRIGEERRLLKDEKPLINIDHHITNDNFGSVNLVDVEASSTAEMLFELLVYWKAALTKSIATNLYCGIMTDTGSFRYENTSPRTHLAVAKLMEFHIDISALYARIYERIPLKDVTVFTRIINRFETYRQGQLVCVELRKNVMSGLSEDFDLRDALFKFLRSIAGVEVIVILTEFTRSVTRVNFRSSSRVNVAKIAGAFGGGGHKRASGCVVEKGMKETKTMILKEIESQL